MSVGFLQAERSLLFCCDVQERFRSLIQNMPRVIQVSKSMIKAANTFEIPSIVTEQYTKAFGNTVTEISSQFNHDLVKVFEKTKFSMLTEPVWKHWKDSYPQRNQIILCGIESHVCVMQTILEITEKDPKVEIHVLVDGVSSIKEMDREIALQRMQKYPNVFVTTMESALFQLMRDSKHPKFKEISSIIKEAQSA